MAWQPSLSTYLKSNICWASMNNILWTGFGFFHFVYLSPPQQWRRGSTDIINKIWMMEALAWPSLCLDVVWSALLFSASMYNWKSECSGPSFHQGLGKQGLLTKSGELCVVRNTRWCFVPGLPMKTSVWRVLFLFVVANLIFVSALQYVLYTLVLCGGNKKECCLWA